RASALVRSYEAARLDDIPVTRPESSRVDVAWAPQDYGTWPGHRSSDLLAVTVDPSGCGAPGPIDIRMRYAADVPTHDITSIVRLERDLSGDRATRLFCPIFS